MPQISEHDLVEISKLVSSSGKSIDAIENLALVMIDSVPEDQLPVSDEVIASFCLALRIYVKALQSE